MMLLVSQKRIMRTQLGLVGLVNNHLSVRHSAQHLYSSET